MFDKIIHTYWTRILATGMVFIAVVLTSRYLGAEGKGVTSLITTNLLFICLANEFVGGVALIYLIPRRQPFSLLIPALFFALIDSLVLAAFFHALDIIPRQYSVHLYFLALLQTGNNTLLYVLLGKEKIEQHNYLFLFKAVINAAVLAVFFIVLKDATVDAFIITLYVSNIIPLIIGTVWLIPYLRREFYFQKMFQLTREMFSYGSFAQLANIVQMLNYRLSFYLLNLFTGQKAVGIYSVALALGDVIWMMSKSISTVQLTRISNTDDLTRGHELTKKFLGFSVLSTGIILLPAIIIPESFYALVFGNEFVEVKKVILATSPGLVIFSANIILATYFGGIGRYGINMMASLVGLAVNLVANILLIPRLGIVGAGIAASLTYVAITLVTGWQFRKQAPLNWKDILIAKQDLKKMMQVIGWRR